ncbi:hypothetical protein C6P40_000217 [Pichia californica]|uniref:NADP-dependent oxidoreductase domain-containing protein n=1 Tax=Pichia californica TaxID=460514 RepID=A0A9P7BFJ7_9ASCO|nr:hypothetical protein C6P42_001237 [[Candida] californica]KAG0689011.1 hypothetical protein C6P40_000217 [[Candida] californica]
MTQQYLTIPQSNDKIPLIGFGSGTKWQWKKKSSESTAVSNSNPTNTDPDLVNSIIKALETGFSHLDTAEFYTTRPDIGKGINDYLLKHPESKRSDIFVTDKYNSHPPNTPNILDDGSIRGPYASLKQGLKLMNLDYIDLFLLHTDSTPEGLSLIDAWKEMIKLKNEGLAKNIGVSNFDIKHLEILKNANLILPQVLQIEFHPYLQNQSPNILNYAKENNILIEAYGPLVPITKAKDEGPLIPLLNELSLKYGVSDTQILLKWVHSFNIVTVTTSSKIERMKDILNVYSLKLSDEDIKKITDVGNTWWYRAFAIPPLPEYNDQLKAERHVINP